MKIASLSENARSSFSSLHAHLRRKYKCVVRACVDSRKKRYELLDNAHIKISEFVNNAIIIGEDYYAQAREDIEDLLFERRPMV